MSTENQFTETAVRRPEIRRRSFGGGDYTSPRTKVPTPSCRKFTLQFNPSSVREQLADALKSITSPSTNPEVSTGKSLKRFRSRSASTHRTMTDRSGQENRLLRRNSKKRCEENNVEEDNINTQQLIMEEASRRVGFVMMLNAWRQCRQQLANSFQQTTNLKSQIDQQKLQINVLRELINSDNLRIKAANEETRLANEGHVSAQATVRSLKNENKILEETISKLERRVHDCTTEIKNHKNSHMVLRSQISALEVQHGKDRDKLAKLREDKKQLGEKLKQTEEKLQQKEIDFETLQAVHLQLEERFDEQRMINATCMDEIEIYNTTIKELQDTTEELEQKYQNEHQKYNLKTSELTQVKDELKTTCEDVRNLHERNESLESSLREARQQLQLQQERPWWSLAAELASSPLGAIHSAARIAMPTLPPADKLIDRSRSERELEVQPLVELVKENGLSGSSLISNASACSVLLGKSGT